MKGEIAIIFDWNAKVRKVDNVEIYKDLPNVVVNPDLKELRLKGIKPLHWKIKDGRVVEKTEEEKLIVDEYHKLNKWSNPEVIKVPGPIQYIDREVPGPIEYKEIVHIKYKTPPNAIIAICVLSFFLMIESLQILGYLF